MVAVPVELPPEPAGPGYDREQLAYTIAVLLCSLDRDHPWRKDALCREYPDVDFFPSRGEPTTEARRVCSRCLVRAECRDLASAQSGTLVGMWSGASGRERRGWDRGPTDARVVVVATSRRAVREKSADTSGTTPER